MITNIQHFGGICCIIRLKPSQKQIVLAVDKQSMRLIYALQNHLKRVIVNRLKSEPNDQNRHAKLVFMG
jgi:hypothetical protein